MTFFEKIQLHPPLKYPKSKYFSFIHFVESKTSLDHIFEDLSPQ